jgi:nucleoside-diphosphate-sugar epimerase
VFQPERQGDVKHSLADIQKAERLLGFKPSVDFAGGLAQTIKYMQANPES